MSQPMPDQTPEGWDRAAFAYERSIDRITGPYGVEALRLLGLRAGERLLDVACGPGVVAFAAVEAGARVVAVDYSPAMIERLQARAAAVGGVDLEAAVMDGQALDLPDGSFDLATCVFGLMFYPDRRKGFRELQRVLRPGGRTAVATWAAPERNPWLSIWREAATAALPDLPAPTAPPPIFSLSDPKLLARELESAGFERVRIVPVLRELRFVSAESFWAELSDASPVFLALAARAGDRIELVQDALFSIIRERCGRGEIVLQAEALVGLGEKPAAR